MDNNFDMSDIGINIDELNRTWQNPETKDVPLGITYIKDTTPEKQAAYERKVKKHSIRMTTYVVIIAVSIILVLVSSMLNNADAAATFIEMEVLEVTADMVTVIDEDGNVWAYYKEKLVCHKGQKALIALEMKYAGQDMWVANMSTAFIVEVK